MEKDCSNGACRPGRAQPDTPCGAQGAEGAGLETADPFRLVRRGCPLKVLIVEDDMIIAADLAGMIEEQGGRVIGTASDSLHAIELGLAHHPDIVLSDVMLRGRSDGVHAAEAIRDLVGSVIVFCTGNVDPETLQRMQAIEGSVVVAKPILSLELHQALAAVLRQRG
jgi:CheY-like chemotaxis protein